MPTIHDNIEKYLDEGLSRTLETSKRADFCIGYFNLRGWRRISKYIEELKGDHLPDEYEDDNTYYCRVLIGMQKLPSEELNDLFARDKNRTLDNAIAIELKRKVAKEFKAQLIIGNPTNEDEIDQIDTVLAQHYGFTEEELDFIITYDIKYRMGKALFGEEDTEEEED